MLPNPRAGVGGLSFSALGRLYTFYTGGLRFGPGARVMAEGAAGVRMGKIEVEPHEPARTLGLRSLHPVLRLAEAGDIDSESENIDREAAARRVCLHRIHERKLTMKLVSVEYMLDARKAVFYFTPETRIYFRDLVLDLANTLRVRVEMKQ